MSVFSEWYGLLCLAILIASAFASLWLILRGGQNSNKDEENERRLLGDDVEEMNITSKEEEEEEEDEDWYCHLWRSKWRCVHPCWLLGLRLMAILSLVGVLLWDAYTYDWSIMLYYTEWTLALVILYFLIASIISAHGCWIYSKNTNPNNKENKYRKRDCEENKSAKLISESSETRIKVGLQNYDENKAFAQKVGFWGYVMQVLYQTSAGAVVLTDIVFWGVLVPFLAVEHFHLDLLMGCMHTFNLVFLLMDTALNSLPFPWFRIAYFVLWSCFYICFQWVIHICGFTWWPYPFLKLSTPRAPLWYFILALLHIPCYSLYCGLVKVKHLLLHTCRP